MKDGSFEERFLRLMEEQKKLPPEQLTMDFDEGTMVESDGETE